VSAPRGDLDEITDYALGRLRTISPGSPRALQAQLGPSEIGQACPRRLAYRIAGTPVVNNPEPTA
jgi:hypothetical protein